MHAEGKESKPSAESRQPEQGMPVPPLPGIDPQVYAQALSNLHSGTVAWVVVSGKMAAGKDTVAPQLADILPRPTGKQPVYLGYGDLMRAELATIINQYSQAQPDTLPLPRRLELVQELVGLQPQDTAELVECLDAEFASRPDGETPSVFDRTPHIRKMLQGLGGPWRTRDNPDYWVRKAAIAALEHAADGQSVILTGARYLPDVQLPAQHGAILIRIDIDKETQLARLGARDGILPTPETLAALDHPGETALDHWDGFTVRVWNVGELQDTVQEARHAVLCELSRRGGGK